MVAVISEIKTLGKQFFPAIFAVRICRISAVFPRYRSIRVRLIMFGIHAGRGTVKDPLYVAAKTGIQDVEIDGSRIMHDIGIILARKNILRQIGDRSPHDNWIAPEGLQ